MCVFALRPVDAVLQLQIHPRYVRPPFVNPIQAGSSILSPRQRQIKQTPDPRERSHGAHPFDLSPASPPTPIFPSPFQPTLPSHQPDPQNGPVRFHLPPSQTATLTPASTSTLYPFPPVVPVPVDDDDDTARNPTRGCRLSTVAYRNCAGLPTPAVQK